MEHIRHYCIETSEFLKTIVTIPALILGSLPFPLNYYYNRIVVIERTY